jgi:sulfite reductase (NADPH) flavoprotein alpha-component
MSDIYLLFGSQSGNAQNLAHQVADALQAAGLETQVHDMGELAPETLLDVSRLIIITSTYGDGEPPDNASEWMSYLKFSDELSLQHLHYAVLGIGDTYYPHFCQCAKDFDHYLSKHGGLSLLPRLDCDLYYEEQYGEWLNQLIEVLKKEDQE